MKVSILFAKNSAWWAVLGRLIMFVEQKPFSHCAVLLEYDGKQVVYDSVFPKGRIMSYQKWSMLYKDILVHEMPDISPWEVAAKLSLAKDSRRYYSIVQLLWILLALFKPFDRWTNWFTLNGHKAMICTELVSRFLELFYQVKFNESHDKIGLVDVHEAVKKLEVK